MDRRRFELCAFEVYEVGKSWAEADGDIREAIDFLLFYAQQVRILGRPTLTQHVLGEESYQHYWPRGVSLVIAPWNFPIAILCGMVSAALVTGNAVIMKPAEQSAVCGALLMEIFEEAGVPPGVLNLLTGDGAVIGKHLVDHKEIDMIAFTGSREVGLKIWESAGKTRPGQRELKRVVCEMGGKNAIIVDSDADLDEATIDTVYSAFGYQGQKCSACSRLIVLEENYDRVVERLVTATASLRVGNPETPGISVGPVIDEEAFERIKKTVAEGKGHATLAFQQTNVPATGYFIGPTIFTDVKPEDAALAVRDFRAGAQRDQSSRSRGSDPRREQHRIRAYRRLFLAQPGQHRAGEGGARRRQCLHQPLLHRRSRRAPSLRWLQDVRRGHEGRRLRLSPQLHRPARRHREHHAPRFRTGNDANVSRRVHGHLDNTADEGQRERLQLKQIMKHLLLVLAAALCLVGCADGIEPDRERRAAAYSPNPAGHVPQQNMSAARQAGF